MGSVEGFSERSGLVWPCHEQVEERNDCAFEFLASAGVDRGWREGAPDDGLADAGRDEQGDTAAETVALL